MKLQLKWLKSSFLKIDAFGAFATILTALLIATFVSYQIQDIANHKFTQKSFSNPLDLTQIIHNISFESFDFAFSISSPIYFQLPEDANLSLLGKQDISLFYILLSECDPKHLSLIYPGKECVSDEELIKKFFKYTQIQFIFTRQYFDYQEFNVSPVKSFVEIQLIDVFIDKQTKVDVQLQQTTAIGSDSILHQSINKFNETLITPEIVVISKTLADNKHYIQLEFSIKNQFNLAERQVYNIVDAFCQSGGLIGMFLILARKFLMPFVDLVYYSSLMKSLFLISKQSLEKQKQSKNDTFDTAGDSFKQKSMIDAFNLANNKPEDYQRLALEISNRIKFKYSSIQFLRDTIFGCPCLRKNKATTIRQLFLYGKRKLDQQLDIKKIIYQLKEFEIIKSILFTRQQRKLLPFIQKNLIDRQFEKKIIKFKPRTQQQKEEQILNLILEHFSENVDPKNSFNKRIFENLVTQGDDLPTQERHRTLKQKMFTGIIKKCIRANTGIQTKETKFASMKIKKGISQSFMKEDEESYDQFMSKQNQNQVTSFRNKSKVLDQSAFNLDEDTDGQQANVHQKAIFKTYDQLPVIDSNRDNKVKRGKIVKKAKTRVIKRPIEHKLENDTEI
ncbi:UNKNOWN [Stylonychia lemnae]|uniref:Transmembrane protein n=1 Tax=Stylonychia lemnae TaxID=5949 RepID=A0A078A0W6_STYLE|nr:UNKNOWN [Stylonychia lemnae]|eukprot:CDW75775.1 UNKNOWN [Stylonychia lemnae]